MKLNMNTFQVDEKVFEVLPDYCIGTIAAFGIDNSKGCPKVQERLKQEAEAFAQKHQNDNIRSLENIQAFRDAFTKLNMNPNKYLCSIESLAKRVQKKGELPSINPIVDLGNLISLKHVLPAGAHDLSKMQDQFIVRFSESGDHFLPMSAKAEENMPENELVYASGQTIKTRRWIWRQSEDGKITDGTSCILYPIDGFASINREQVLEARDELASLLKETFGCQVITGFIDKSHPVFQFEKEAVL